MITEKIICSYREYIYNVLKKRFIKAKHEDLEDVVQEALINACRFKHKWQGKSSIKTWLVKIAMNIYYDTFRKAYSKHENTISIEEQEMIFNREFIDDFSETFCERDCLTDLFDEYKDNLYFETFKLSFIDEVEYKDISKQQNIPMGTVKSRIFKARKILQETYLQKYSCNDVT